jgi:hypothetical protein
VGGAAPALRGRHPAGWRAPVRWAILRHVNLLILIPTFAVIAAAQGPASPEQVSAKMKDYLRGVTENRFDVVCKISNFDANGKLRKVRNTTHRLEFTQGRYRGTGQSADTDWAASIVVSKANRRTIGLEMFTDMDGLLVPGFLVANKSFEIEPTAMENGGARVGYRSKDACASFVSAGDGFKHGGTDCGAGEVVLDAAGPVRAIYEALGLPLAQGKRQLTKYRVEAEFQKGAVVGSKDVQILPKIAVATITFSDQKTVVESRYTLHSGKW